jgi:hypothetical protein
MSDGLPVDPLALREEVNPNTASSRSIRAVITIFTPAS